ncbi:MAG: hypothetical protein M1370_06020 [Bacteroidetes bacterium]|nr:hypothetical protein [Bacteroidota bacterium]MCL5026869.1 hypothetical protein [Chloroflexota bacterium]
MIETTIGRKEWTERVARLHAHTMDLMRARRQPWREGFRLSVLNGETRKLPLIVRKAMAFSHMLASMPVAIGDDELLVGCIPTVYSLRIRPFPRYATDEEMEKALARGLRPQSVFGHYVPGYPKLLAKGLSGIMDDARKALGRLAKEPASPDKGRKRAFYRAVVICCQGAIAFAHRYARLAEEMAASCPEAKRAAELRRIGATLRWVPEHPPRTLYEALQCFWLTHVIFHSTMDIVPCGRFDQYMWPFLRRDLEEGVLTQEEAQELLDCLWLKFNEQTVFDVDQVQLQPDEMPLDGNPSAMEQSAVNNWLQNIILGGQTPQGRDATNELTYMCLESTHKLELTNPVVSVRFFRNSPPELLRAVCEILRDGGGQPAIFNDEAFVPGLMKVGFSLEEARDYSNDGCWEAIVPGRTEFRFSTIGLLKCLEYALFDGHDLLTGERVAPATGHSQTYEELRAAFKAQMAHAVEATYRRVAEELGNHYHAEIAPVPFLSALLEGPMESGRDITEGGARHRLYGFVASGLANSADSLSAVRKLVSEERVLTMDQLREALRTDFAGQETLRQVLVSRAPKYGNDDERADSLLLEIARDYIEMVEQCRRLQTAWLKCSVGFGTFENYLVFGQLIGASADGRHAREALASNCSPSIGQDVEGPTAAVRSFTKLDMTRIATGSPLDLRVNGASLRDGAGLERLMAFVGSFLSMGGNILTVTVADTETLRRAQREPEKYRSLRVRMGGWSAYFVTLSKEQQEVHIRRSEHRF